MSGHLWDRRVVMALGGLAITAVAALAAEESVPAKIRHVELVHFSHTDYGFTDHPAVCRQLQRRYLDIAIDGVLATCDKPPEARLAWTAETTVAVLDWWQSASPDRREEFLRAVDSGQLEITALPLNNTPFLDAAQWRTMLCWLPEELWQRLRPRAAVQNDVNGMPRAAAMALLDRDIRYLMSGINEDSGGAPFRRPSAFWWKMPDGRKLFVYLNYSYPMGYWFFEPVEWRRGPVPRAADTCYRLPRPGDFLAADEASVRKAHRHLLDRLKGLEAQGFSYPTLVLSITNQWRIDNDPPLLFLPDFVAAWHRLGLKPTLRLTTVSAAMQRLEQEIGALVPTYEGEWTDWWANGTASAPREVSASRLAKRLLAAAESPVWGPMPPAARTLAHELRKELCLFDEHTWGSSNSVALPYSLDSLAQFNEKARLAWRPMAEAEWLLAQRVRTRLVEEGEGVFLANPAPLPWTGWIRLAATALREDYRSLEDPVTGMRIPLEFEPGLRPFTPPAGPAEVSPENTAATFPDRAPGQVARFWLGNLQPRSIRRLRFSKGAAGKHAEPSDNTPSPTVAVDEKGWPVSATWPGMPQPLFAGLGDLVSVSVKGFAPRWRAREIWGASDADRQRLRKEHLEEIAATPAGNTAVAYTAHTVVYTQGLRHPRLAWATRQLELWKRQSRARLVLRFYRNPSEAPEALFVSFTLPCQGTMPRASCGGVPFVPYHDQLPGTCRDYFAIDAWVDYTTPQGHWLWVSRDAPLVTFGGQQVLARRRSPPAETHRVLAMVYNNFWYTNFVGDSPGVMEFQFDIAWQAKPSTAPADIAETLLTEPPVMINPREKENRIVIERLYKP